MTDDIFESTAVQYEQSAHELEQAAAHLRITAAHFRGHDVARGCAHAFAAYGHIRVTQRQIDDHAEQHRLQAGI